MGLECEWRQKSCSWEFEDFKKVIEFFTIEGCSWVFRIWSDQIIFSDLDQKKWIEILNTTRCTARWGGVSIVCLNRFFSIVSLSSCRQWLKPDTYKPVRIWSNRVRLYMYCITIIIDIFMSIQQYILPFNSMRTNNWYQIVSIKYQWLKPFNYRVER